MRDRGRAPDGAGVSAWDLYEQGREAEKGGHMAQAYLLYSQAAAMEPKNRNYWLRSQAVKSRAALEAKPMPPPPEAGLDPETRGPPGTAARQAQRAGPGRGAPAAATDGIEGGPGNQGFRSARRLQETV